jgi:hypothetical protein
VAEIARHGRQLDKHVGQPRHQRLLQVSEAGHRGGARGGDATPQAEEAPPLVAGPWNPKHSTQAHLVVHRAPKETCGSVRAQQDAVDCGARLQEEASEWAVDFDRVYVAVVRLDQDMCLCLFGVGTAEPSLPPAWAEKANFLGAKRTLDQPHVVWRSTTRNWLPFPPIVEAASAEAVPAVGHAGIVGLVHADGAVVLLVNFFRPDCVGSAQEGVEAWQILVTAPQGVKDASRSRANSEAG